MLLYIRVFFEAVSRKYAVSLKSDKNNGYITWRHVYIYDSIKILFTNKCTLLLNT